MEVMFFQRKQQLMDIIVIFSEICRSFEGKTNFIHDQMDLILSCPNIIVHNLGVYRPQFNLNFNSSLNFFHVSIFRSENKFKTNWYHKSSWCRWYINFFSFHPIQHIFVLIKGLIDRAFLFLDPKYCQNNLKLIQDTLGHIIRT